SFPGRWGIWWFIQARRRYSASSRRATSLEHSGVAFDAWMEELMPIYEYLDVERGEVVEIAKPHDKSDPIDSVIVHEGRKLKRIASGHTIFLEPIPDNPRPRRNLSKGMPGFEHYDKRGYPVASNAELRRRGFVPNPWLDIIRDD